eukprot:183975-Pelagomonas_calceolata.AAC.1
MAKIQYLTIGSFYSISFCNDTLWAQVLQNIYSAVSGLDVCGIRQSPLEIGAYLAHINEPYIKTQQPNHELKACCAWMGTFRSSHLQSQSASPGLLARREAVSNVRCQRFSAQQGAARDSSLSLKWLSHGTLAGCYMDTNRQIPACGPLTVELESWGLDNFTLQMLYVVYLK